jgi:hypothetical protein
MHFDLSEESAWASGMAARLRVLQANSSDAAGGAQQEFISEELERALKEVVPSKRKLFLQALGEHFPAWLVAPAGNQVSVAKPEIVEDTPERRLEALLQVAPDLTVEERLRYAAKLKAAGFTVAERGGSLPSSPELEKALGGNLPQLEAERALKLLALTTAFALTLEQLVWNLWKQIAQRSTIKRESGPANDLRLLMRRYVAGESEISAQQINQLIEQSRRLTAGLLMAMGGAGPEFAKKFQERFAPNEIEELARLEKKFSQSIENVCWKKYGELYKDFGSEAAIDSLIEEAVVLYAERVMRGQQASP